MTVAAQDQEPPSPAAGARRIESAETAFGCARDFLENRFVYVVISPRARGLSIGVNMNPDKHCSFDCLYCEVNRNEPPVTTKLDLDVLADELARTIRLVRSGEIRSRTPYKDLPEELLQLRHLALSGDGEPTMSPVFVEAVQTVMHVRARSTPPFFKIVLITNTTGMDRPEVQRGLKYFTQQDEVWVKLDAGTQAYMDRINKAGSECDIQRILASILFLAKQRPVVVQSLFASIRGESPSTEEVEQYARRLTELRDKGAQISMVQIYSATRPTPHSDCGHLPLRTLSFIAQTVRKTGLRAEVF